jgi:hypothetical protein
MVRAVQNVSQAGPGWRFPMQPIDLTTNRRLGPVLKTCCIRRLVCENIGALFPSETEPASLASGVFADPMNSVVITTVLIPGFVSALLFLVFTYLHEQSRQQYFRAWQLAWAAYSLHYVLDTFPSSSLAFFISQLFMVAMVLCIFVSTRMMHGPSQPRWYDAAVGTTGVVLALLTLRGHIVNGIFRPDAQPAVQLGIGLASFCCTAPRFSCSTATVADRWLSRCLPSHSHCGAC